MKKNKNIIKLIWIILSILFLLFIFQTQFRYKYMNIEYYTNGLNIEHRIDRLTGKVQYFFDGHWYDKKIYKKFDIEKYIIKEKPKNK